MAVLAAVVVPTVTAQVDKAEDANTVTEANELLRLINNEWVLGSQTIAQIEEAIEGKDSGRIADLEYYSDTSGTADYLISDKSSTVVVRYIRLNNVVFKNSKYTSNLENNIAVDKSAGTYYGELNLMTGYIYFNR